MDDEWAKTINEEYGTDVTADEPDAPEPDTPEPDTPEPDTPDGADAPEPEADVSEDEPEAPEAPETPETPETPEAPEAPHNPKDDIKSAIRELQAETQQDQTVKSQMRDLVLESLYPEGIDRQLRDSDGDPITSIDDLTKLINPKTDELFTEDEAGSWLLAAQQKLNNEVAQIERQAEQIVETELNLRDGANRVEKIYGDILKNNPKLADSLMSQYNNTIARDPKSGLILSTPVDINDFYSTALGGYEQAMQLQREQQAAAAKAEAAQKKASQHERADLGRLGAADESLSKEDKGWVDAMKDYYKE